MVSAHVYRIDDQLRIYILPSPFNEKIDFPAQVAQAKAISTNVGVGSRSRLLIEDVGYQAVLIQALESERYPASGYKPQGQDKRSRLSLAPRYKMERYSSRPKAMKIFSISYWGSQGPSMTTLSMLLRL